MLCKNAESKHEIAGFGMGNVNSGNAGLREHSAVFGQLNADGREVEGLTENEHRPLVGERRIADGGTNAAPASGGQFTREKFGSSFGQAVAESLHEDCGVIIAALVFQRLEVSNESGADGGRKKSDVVIADGRNVVAKRKADIAARAVGLHKSLSGRRERHAAIAAGAMSIVAVVAHLYHNGIVAADGGKESRAFSRDHVIRNTTGCAGITSSMGADFLLYQEVDIKGTRSHFVNEAELLASVIEENDNINWIFAQNYNSPYILYPFSSPHGRNKSGLMTASHFKIQEATRRSLPIEKGLSRLVDLDRCYAKTVFSTRDSRKFIVYNVHLSAYTTNPETGNDQIRMICNDMDEEYKKGNYVLTAGDMNKEIFEKASELFGKSGKDYSWCQPFPKNLLSENLILVPPCRKESPVPTSRNTDIPYGPDNFVTIIDGFIVSKNIRVLATEVLKTDFEFSDHNPIYMDFILSDEN